MNFDGMKKRQKTGRIRIEIVNVFPHQCSCEFCLFPQTPSSRVCLHLCEQKNVCSPEKINGRNIFERCNLTEIHCGTIVGIASCHSNDDSRIYTHTRARAFYDFVQSRFPGLTCKLAET